MTNKEEEIKPMNNKLPIPSASDNPLQKSIGLNSDGIDNDSFIDDFVMSVLSSIDEIRKEEVSNDSINDCSPSNNNDAPFIPAVVLRGLPYSCNEEETMLWIKTLIPDLAEDDVKRVILRRDEVTMKNTGFARILLKSNDLCTKLVNGLHKQKFGHRYIEVFPKLSVGPKTQVLSEKAPVFIPSAQMTFDPNSFDMPNLYNDGYDPYQQTTGLDPNLILPFEYNEYNDIPIQESTPQQRGNTTGAYYYSSLRESSEFVPEAVGGGWWI